MSENELETLKQRGNQAFKDGDLTSAKSLYTDAIRLADKSSEVCATLLCNRAACHIKLLDWALCIEDCTAAIAINPSMSKALYRRALAFEATNEYSRSFLDLNTLLRYDPKNNEAINLMRKVKSQVMLEQADASQVKSILDNVQKEPKHLLDGIKTLIGLTYDDKNHAIDFARKGGITWIMGVINREYEQSVQASKSSSSYDLSLLMAALRLLSACSNHKDFVMKYVDVNNNDNGLYNDNRFMRSEIQLIPSSGRISLISVCSLLEHFDSTVVQIVIVFMMSILKVVPASDELLLLDNIKAMRAKKNQSSSAANAGESEESESTASASIVVDADIRYSLEPDTVQAVVCGFKAALKAVHVDIFSLIADSLCAFLSEHPDYFEPARATDTRLENLLERKIRLRETRIFKGRSVSHATAAVGCGLVSLLVDLLDHSSHSSVRQSAGSCLGKLVNFYDNEEKIKGKLQPYLKGAADPLQVDSESKVVELPPDDLVPPSLAECRRRAALTAVLLISRPELGAWALSLPGGVPQLLFLVSTMDPRCQELAAEVMCLAASNTEASSQLSSIVANGTLTTLLHSPYAGTRAAAASTITKLSLKAKALSEDSAEVSQILNTVLAVLKSANGQKTSSSGTSDGDGSSKVKELASFSALDEVGERSKKAALKAQKEEQQQLVRASDSSLAAVAGASSAAVTMTSVERAIEVLAAMVGKTFIKEEIVHGSYRVVSCVAELAKLDLDVRSTAAYGFTHIFAALTVTNSELRAKALAEKDITPAQFEQMQELQRIKTKDEEGNVIEEKKEDSDPDSAELCRRRIQRIVAVNSISTLVRYLSNGSAQTKEAAARTLRQICVEESSRGLMLQQGGFKACTTEANDEDNAKNTRLECAHVVAKTLVTTNPNLLTEHQRLGAIKPLVMLCRESDASYLQQFEALLALTNLLSCGSDEHDRFTSERGVQAVHYLIFSDNLMVRRAAMETLCNMSSHEGLLKLLKDGEKLRLWLGLAEDWNNSNSEPADVGAAGAGVTEAFLTARAAAGTLAGAAGEAEVAEAMIGQDIARTVVSLLESENKELVHRALVIVLELLGHGKRAYAEHLMGGGVIPCMGLVTKMGEPFLADLAMKCAKGMSDLLKEQKA